MVEFLIICATRPPPFHEDNETVENVTSHPMNTEAKAYRF